MYCPTAVQLVPDAHDTRQERGIGRRVGRRLYVPLQPAALAVPANHAAVAAAMATIIRSRRTFLIPLRRTPRFHANGIA